MPATTSRSSSTWSTRKWARRVRVVLDTNILIAALITKGTPPDQLYQAWLRGQVEVVTSVAQLREIAEVLARPRLQRYLDTDERSEEHTSELQSLMRISYAAF